MEKPQISYVIKQFFLVLFFFTGVILTCFALYLLPYILFEINYDLPTFVFTYFVWLRETFTGTHWLAEPLLFISFLLPGLFLLLIVHIANRIMEKNIFKQIKTKQVEENFNTTGESFWLVVKLLLLVLILLYIMKEIV